MALAMRMQKYANGRAPLASSEHMTGKTVFSWDDRALARSVMKGTLQVHPLLLFHLGAKSNY